MAVVLIGGGARSGKSRFALEYAEQRFASRAFVATAEALDSEMADRIRHHQQSRGAAWKTLDAPLNLVAALSGAAAEFDVVVVDCLTLWLSNILLDPERDVENEIDNLVRYLAEPTDSASFGPPSIVLVTNEVGSGIVPDNELGRNFRDIAGVLNQRVAQTADEVYWMAFGIPMTIKKPSSTSRLGDE